MCPREMAALRHLLTPSGFFTPSDSSVFSIFPSRPLRFGFADLLLVDLLLVDLLLALGFLVGTALATTSG